MSKISPVRRFIDLLRHGPIKVNFRLKDGTLVPCEREFGKGQYFVHTYDGDPVVLPDKTKVHFSHGILTHAENPDGSLAWYDASGEHRFQPTRTDFEFCLPSSLLHWRRKEHADGSVSEFKRYEIFSTCRHIDGKITRQDIHGRLMSPRGGPNGDNHPAVEYPDGSKEWWSDGRMTAAQDKEGYMIRYGLYGGELHISPKGLSIHYGEDKQIRSVTYPDRAKDWYEKGKPVSRENGNGETIIRFIDGQGYSVPTIAEHAREQEPVDLKTQQFITEIANAVMHRMIPAEVLTRPDEAAQGKLYQKDNIPPPPSTAGTLDDVRDNCLRYTVWLELAQDRANEVFKYLVKAPEDKRLPASNHPFVQSRVTEIRAMQAAVDQKLAPRPVGPYVMQSPLPAPVAA